MRTTIPSLALMLAGAASAAEPAKIDLDARFKDTIRPFVSNYCIACHTGPQAMAQFDLAKYTTLASVAEDHGHWALVVEKLAANEMPPKSATRQPDAATRRKVAGWVEALLKEEARKTAGDPGIVLARRLSNSEYNYTIRDLTGVDIRPTKEFPVDPANPSGFDNSGESLSMSPNLLNKYLQAAREVANHMILKPDGIAFAPHLALVETDRDKYVVNEIIDLYSRQNTNYSDYFLAAWQFKHRAALGKPRAALNDFAAANRVSSKYLHTVWKTLETKEEIGPLAKLQAMWNALPVPRGNQPEAGRAGADRMRDFVTNLRKKVEYKVTLIQGPRGAGGNGQPFLMWRNNQYANNRRNFNRDVLQVEGEVKRVEKAATVRPPADDFNAAEEIEQSRPAQAPSGPDPDLHVPAGQRERYEAAFARFAAVFPDTFFISERGRYFPDNTRDKGRHLSAGFHNLMGYFRDDKPLYELILDEKQQQELDGYWRELDFVAMAAHRTYTQFYLFESGEMRTPGAPPAEAASAASAEDKEITSEARIMKVKQNYLERAKANPLAVQAVEEHFNWVNQNLRWVEKAKLAAEPVHLADIQNFAARAYRRPLTAQEKDDLMSYYRTLRDKEGLSHEDAMRDLVVMILMSPDFCYRIDLVAGNTAPARGGELLAMNVAGHHDDGTLLAQAAPRRASPPKPAGAPRPSANPAASVARLGALPLSDHALASRLSYYLWSSMPDDELMAKANAGELKKLDVLTTQARRMLKDKRAEALAVEFAGNWLDFRRFEEHNAVDRERFPMFNNELRQAMFEEPVKFITNIVQNNGSVLDFLYGDYTFVNPVLARHYGMTDVKFNGNEWVRLDNAGRYERGGLLPMAVFLTKNAPGLRTSPVKRGYWVVRRVLGEVIPPPPPVVPELPKDEAKMDASLREMLAQHRADPACSGCHARFDSFGLALEGYGPVGEARKKDLAGRDVETRAEYPGGAEGVGLEGLRTYIKTSRQNDFIDNLCRKMLSYALGRGLLLSDEPLIESMRTKLAANGYKFNVLVESIVTSPQFLTKRAQPERKSD